MMVRSTRTGTFVLWLVVASTCSGEDWRQFRGTSNTSVADASSRLPTEWDQQRNVAWKVALPGRGPSSPIVVGRRVFVTCSGGANQERLYVLAFDTATGKEMWRREFWGTGRTLTNSATANAAPTPASDGHHVLALFSSSDLVCLDLEGNLKWYRGLGYDYPKAGNDVGMASSPVLVQGVCVVQIESQSDSFVAGIDVATGTNRWRIARPLRANWASPTILRGTDGSARVLLQNTDGIAAHDPRTGEEIWRLDIECEGIPSPATSPPLVFVPATGTTAVSIPGADGEATVAWSSAQLSTGASSVVVCDGRIYTVNRSSVLSCGDAQTGKVNWKLRLGISRMWATPVIAGNLAYCVDNEGTTAVVRLGEKGELINKNSIDEPIQASPAIAQNALYLRSDEHLWKIAAE